VLLAAIDETVILGLTTNAGFLRALVASEEFREASIDTAWLDRHELPAPGNDLARLLVAWTAAMLTAADPSDPERHAFQPDGFRLGAAPAPVRVELDRDVSVVRAPAGRSGTVDGVGVRQLSARPLSGDDPSGQGYLLALVVDGRPVHAVVQVPRSRHGVSFEVALHGQRHAFTPPDRLAGSVDVSDGTVVAPMPGTVLDVRVAAGDTVAEGQTLGVLEAMKMELSLAAPFEGTVAEVAVAPGDQVALGARLMVVDPAGGQAGGQAGDAPAAGRAQSAP